MTDKFKSRKFLLTLITNLVAIIFAALALYLTPEQYDGVMQAVKFLTPLMLGALVTFGYISAEGKADMLGILHKITETQAAVQLAGSAETLKDKVADAAGGKAADAGKGSLKVVGEPSAPPSI
jgi:uncharacterized membrane protein